MTLSIPQEKMTEVKQCMNTFMLSRNVTKRQIQSLAGKLNWITQCVYGGRFHMRRLIESANKLRKPWHRQNATKDMKQDILWWLNFMEVFNGCMPMVDCRPVSYPVCIDACKFAAGAFHQGDFVYKQWTASVASLPINYLEDFCLWSQQLNSGLICGPIRKCLSIVIMLQHVLLLTKGPVKMKLLWQHCVAYFCIPPFIIFD